MTVMEERARLIKALKKHYKTEVMYGKGGFWIRGKNGKPTKVISLAQARKVTGIKSTMKRSPAMVRSSWGDYATIEMINRPRKKG